MRTDNCTHPAWIISYPDALASAEATAYLEEAIAQHSGNPPALAIDHGGDVHIIECSWCENADAVAQRSKLYGSGVPSAWATTASHALDTAGFIAALGCLTWLAWTLVR